MMLKKYSMGISDRFARQGKAPLNVKKASPFTHTYVVSLTNGYFHYASPASYYPRGGYEVTECMLAPEWETVFMEVVRDIFGNL